MPLKLICKTDKLKDFTKGKEYTFEQEGYLMFNVKCDDGEYYAMTKYKMFEYFTFDMAFINTSNCNVFGNENTQ